MCSKGTGEPLSGFLFVHLYGAKLSSGLQFFRTVSILPTEAGEPQADGVRNRTTTKRTLAVLKGLFKALGGLTPGEREQIFKWQSRAVWWIHYRRHSGASRRSVHVCARHRDVLGAFILKWKTCLAPSVAAAAAAAHHDALCAT